MSKNIPFDKVFTSLLKSVTSLNFYPVGDLVNKLSNYGKDNIIHRDEIRYNKNRNLKIKQFLIDSSKLFSKQQKSEDRTKEETNHQENIKSPNFSPFKQKKNEEEAKVEVEEKIDYKNKLIQVRNHTPPNQEKTEEEITIGKIISSHEMRKESEENKVKLLRLNSSRIKSKKKSRKVSSISNGKYKKITNYFKK